MTGVRVWRTARSTAPSRPSGPRPQFRPHAAGAGAANGSSSRSTGSPTEDSPSSLTAKETMNGSVTPAAGMAAAAVSASARGGSVSKMRQSTPPAASAAICSASSSIRFAPVRPGCESGPTEPATNTCRLEPRATSQASSAAARLIAAVFSAKPKRASASRFAP